MHEYKVIGTRRFYELQAGDIFKAMIQNIRPGEVTIRFREGELYTARSYVLPDARIGEEGLFCVQENDFEGRIVLKMIKLDTEVRKTKMLTEALQNARLAPTEEMLGIARELLNSGLPADAQTLQKAAALAAEHSVPEIIALLLDDVPASQKNIPPTERFSFDIRV